MLSTQYEVFYEVASHLSFSKAGKSLFLTQPAVSKHVKNLESQLGISLFDRNGSRIQLTTPGETLLKYLHEAKIVQKQIEFDLAIMKNQQAAKGELAIGASTTISLYTVPKIISQFHKLYPNVKIQLMNRNSERIIAALLNKEIDLGIVEGVKKISSISYQYFTNDEIIPVCSIHSPYASHKLKFDDLKTVPLALREQGSGTLEVLSSYLEKRRIRLRDLNVKVKIGGTEALKNFLVEDICLGFLPRKSVTKELATESLMEVNIDGFKISRKFYFIMRQGESQLGVLKEFLKTAKSAI